MATRNTKIAVHPLDREPLRSMIRRANEAAEQALARYGEPTKSLEEVRAMLDVELGDISLAEEAIRNRKAGF